MKRVIIILGALILASFLSTSCQKAKETEGKKEVVQQQKEEVVQQPVDIKPVETKPVAQPKQQPSVPIEIKAEKKEKPKEIKPSPLTEEEQREFEKLKKKWLSPKFTEEDALSALRVLLKANLDVENVRWYSREAKEWDFTQDICDVVRILSSAKKKEAFEMVVEILEKHKDSILEVTCTIKSIKIFGDKTVIQILRPYLTYTYPKEKYASSDAAYGRAIKEYERTLKLETAGTLLELGDADAALPVLDELAKGGATTALGYIFHHMEGKEWEKKGLGIIKKAYNYDIKENKAALEAKVLAALFLIRLNEGDKTAIEDALITITEEILAKKQWPISSYGYSDHRTLETIIIAFKELKDKKTILLLKRIAKHPEASYLTRWANDTIEYLSAEKGGEK